MQETWVRSLVREDPACCGVTKHVHVPQLLSLHTLEPKLHNRRSHCNEKAAAAKSLQSCPTLCDPIDGSPPGSPVPGILQARMLEWVAIAFSNA